MKRLSENLKQMLNALAIQDAVDPLPTNSKTAMPGGGGDTPDFVTAGPELLPAQPRRVAMLSDGKDIDGVLEYALEACRRQQASLDLVLHGIGKQVADKLRERIMGQGILHEMILLGDESVTSLVEYLNLRRSLFYVIAPADDHLVLELTEKVLPGHSGWMYLPIVLVDRFQRTPITQTKCVNTSS